MDKVHMSFLNERSFDDVANTINSSITSFNSDDFLSSQPDEDDVKLSTAIDYVKMFGSKSRESGHYQIANLRKQTDKLIKSTENAYFDAGHFLENNDAKAFRQNIRSLYKPILVSYRKETDVIRTNLEDLGKLFANCKNHSTNVSLNIFDKVSPDTPLFKYLNDKNYTNKDKYTLAIKIHTLKELIEMCNKSFSLLKRDSSRYTNMLTVFRTMYRSYDDAMNDILRDIDYKLDVKTFLERKRNINLDKLYDYMLSSFRDDDVFFYEQYYYTYNKDTCKFDRKKESVSEALNAFSISNSTRLSLTVEEKRNYLNSSQYVYDCKNDPSIVLKTIVSDRPLADMATMLKGDAIHSVSGVEFAETELSLFSLCGDLTVGDFVKLVDEFNKCTDKFDINVAKSIFKVLYDFNMLFRKYVIRINTMMDTALKETDKNYSHEYYSSRISLNLMYMRDFFSMYANSMFETIYHECLLKTVVFNEAASAIELFSKILK